MKKNYAFLLSLSCILFLTKGFAQNVAINATGALPDSNAMLDVSATNKGVLIPRISSIARFSIPATRGLLVYDTTTNSFWYHTGANWQNLAPASGGWSLTGNSGTDSTNFIGTINDQPFIIKVGSRVSGEIQPRAGSISYGYMAGTSGSMNTAIGNYSLGSNTSGGGNSACGYSALYANTTGFENTAYGTLSLNRNTTGNTNTSIGSSSLSQHITGDNNTAIGASALDNDVSGRFNTGVGELVMNFNTQGSFNTAIGAQALSQNRSGNYNTAIGFVAGVSDSSLTNTTAIGFGAFVNASNKVRIGNAAVTVIEGQVPFTTPSDGRFKFNVQDDVKGLEFITRLRPVTYQFDVKRFDAQQASLSTKNDVQWATYDEATMMRRSGFIAQEVENAAVASGYDFSGLIKPKTTTEHYSLSYESFVVPLVKAVQELNNRLEAQNDKLADLQHQLGELKKLLPAKQ